MTYGINLEIGLVENNFLTWIEIVKSLLKVLSDLIKFTCSMESHPVQPTSQHKFVKNIFFNNFSI